MTQTRNILLASFGAALLAAPAAVSAQAAAAAPQSAILIIDLEQVFVKSAAGINGDAQLKTKVAALQARAKQLQDGLNTDADALRKQQAANAIAPAALQAKAQELQQRQQAAQAEVQSREQDFQTSQRYVQQQILQAVGPITQQIMRERGAQVALRADATLAMNPALDATAEVIKRLDVSLPRVSITPPAAPAAK